jgi:hypothetical protein
MRGSVKTQETVGGKAAVTFTGQVECNSSAPQIYVHTSLFNCWSVQPRASKDFLAGNCGNMTGPVRRRRRGPAEWARGTP